jgi:hypothetical protein
MNICRAVSAMLVVYMAFSLSPSMQARGAVEPDNTDRVKTLIDRIRHLRFVEEPPDEIKRDIEKRLEYSQGQAAKREAARDEVERTMRDLAGIGDEAIVPVVEAMRRYPNTGYERVLLLMGTETARAALLDAALGGNKRGFKAGNGLAAVCYLQMIDAKEDARKLLASDNPNVHLSALHHLEGVGVDEELLNRLGSLLRAEHAGVVSAAGRVLQADSSHELLGPKISLVLRLIEEQARLLDEEVPEPSHEGMMSGRYGTYVRYTEILCNINGKGVNEILSQRSSSSANVHVKRSVAIAKAHHGDRHMKQELHRILQETEGKRLRALAVAALEHIGTSEDLPLLRRIVETDPLEITIRIHKKVGDKVYSNWPETVYPVRDAARRAIGIIERRNKDQ